MPPCAPIPYTVLRFSTRPLRMNPGLSRLQPYPFERLAELRKDLPHTHALSPINLSIGEPQHPTPALVREALVAALEGTAKYPATKGEPMLRQTISSWLSRRFGLPSTAVDAERMVLPVNGTREALFAIAQALVPRSAARDAVLMPNPFYQIYEGAALLAGAEPVFMPCPADQGFLPDVEALPAALLDRCSLMYVCTPSNPAGSVMSCERLVALLDLADAAGLLPGRAGLSIESDIPLPSPEAGDPGADPESFLRVPPLLEAPRVTSSASSLQTSGQ